MKELTAKEIYLKEALSEAFYSEGVADLFDTLDAEKQNKIVSFLQSSLDCADMNFHQPSQRDYIKELQENHARELAIAANSMVELSKCCDGIVISSYQGMGDYRNTCSKCDRFCQTYIKRN